MFWTGRDIGAGYRTRGAVEQGNATSACPLKPADVVAGKVTDSTRAIQEAIDHCSTRGGGVVLLQKGIYLSGPLSLRDNVTLRLARGSLQRAIDIQHAFVTTISADGGLRMAYADKPVMQNVRIHASTGPSIIKLSD